MTMEAAKYVAEARPDLLYIQITAWSTVALVAATIGFSVPVRYWWRALESHVAKMRADYHDATIYERCEQLAASYGEAESVGRRVQPISEQDLAVYLTSEAA